MGYSFNLGATSGGNPAAVWASTRQPTLFLIWSATAALLAWTERARLYLDGHVLLERQGADPVTFQLSPAEQAQLNAALDAADFYRNAAQSRAAGAGRSPDAFQYRVHRRGVLLQGEVVTQDGSVPTWLEPLLPLLTNLLLNAGPGARPALPAHGGRPASTQR